MSTQIAQANKPNKNDKDFQIPAAGGAAPAPANPQAGKTMVGEAVQAQVPIQKSIASTDWVIAGAVILVLAGLFMLGRRAVVGALTAGYADYARAKNAGNMMFLLLLTLGVAATVGIVGNLWTNILFTLPAAGLSVLFLILFIVTFMSARNSARR